MHWLDCAKRALLGGAASPAGTSDKKRAAPKRRVWAFEPLEPRLVLSGAPGLVPVGSPPTGTLDGKIVYVSAGHGWEFKSGIWTTDRPNLHSMIEPFGAQDQLTIYADYLLRAGATVVPMRPVGRQVNEVVLDNDLPGVTFTGSWSNNTVGPRWYDENYGATTDVVKYRFASTSATETAVATYTPNIPQAGFYPVYTWASSGSNRTSQLYKINHTGGQSQIRVDHSQVGNGWVYLGTYHFDAGSSSTLGSVQISNQGAAGKVVIADAIRFGNGMGDLPMGSGGIGTGTVSGQPREDEAALLWTYRGLGQGASHSSVLGTSNVSAPLRMAAHMNSSPYGTSVYIGIHSNAFNGAARGAVGLVHSTVSSRTPNQASLATFTARQIETDMQALNGQFEHTWASRNYTLAGSYGEITNSIAAGQFDATIIEVGFHDNVQDAQLMRDPKARDQIGRSLYEASLEYFRLVSSPQPANITLPSAPRNVHVVSSAESQVTVSWAAGLIGGGVAGVYGNAATGFRIYASTDGYGFDGGTFVAGGSATSATLSGYDPTIPYYFKVAAVNAGGESKPSEVLTVLPSGGEKQVLIVSGFDRQDRDQNFQYTSLPPRNTGVSDRVWPRYNNSFDYVVQVHSAIHAARPGIHVASTSNEAVINGSVNLGDYHTVVWILGNEGGSSLSGARNVNRTFDATEQTKVEQFIAGGGNFFVSGSDIAWDLDAQNNGRSFFRNTLGASYVANSAGTYTATVAGSGIFAGMNSFAFSNGSAFSNLDGQLYNVNSADVLSAQPGSVVALNYGGGAAAIQKQGTGGRGSVVVFGFPFEAMTNATRRQNAIGRVFDFFDLHVIPLENPAVEIKKYVNGEDAASPPGPDLAVGTTATFTYVVTNAGDVSLSNVVVLDDNGTPGDTADDFNPTFVGGDTNGNGLLDVGETWTYSATHLVTSGQHTSLATVSGDGTELTVMDSDAVNYVGVTPAIQIKVWLNGQVADSPPGPTLTVGSTVTFVYSVTNHGNVALTGVVVVDDNGTPGDTSDDFNPTFQSGDSNGNGLLEPWEWWFFTAEHVVSAGQYTGTATITAEGGGQMVSSSDQVNYFGVVPENADFTGSGVVDAADYVLWRKHNGLASGATQSQGDANGDGAVDQDDYDIWRAQFGSSPGIGTSAAIVASESNATPLTVHAVAVSRLENEESALPQSNALPNGAESSSGHLVISRSLGGPAVIVSIEYSSETLTPGLVANFFDRDDEAPAMRDAAFSALGVDGGDHGPRPAVKAKERILARADRVDWEALLARLAERKARRDAQDLDPPSDRLHRAGEDFAPLDRPLKEALLHERAGRGLRHV